MSCVQLTPADFASDGSVGGIVTRGGLRILAKQGAEIAQCSAVQASGACAGRWRYMRQNLFTSHGYAGLSEAQHMESTKATGCTRSPSCGRCSKKVLNEEQDCDIVSDKQSRSSPRRPRRRSSNVRRAQDAAAVWALLDTPDVQAVLENCHRLDSWNGFEFDTLTRHRPLATLTFWCLRKVGLIQHFALPEEKLMAFLCSLEHTYVDNPYHNRMHAADVTRSIYVMLESGMAKYFSEEQQLALYIGGAGHDAEHGGLSNSFLCTTNVRSPLSR